MEMDDVDKQDLLPPVSEDQEEEDGEEDSFMQQPRPLYKRNMLPISKTASVFFVLLAILILLLVGIMVLQVATVVTVRQNEACSAAECPCSSMTNESLANMQNNTELLQRILDITQGSAEMLTRVTHSLLNLENSDSVTQGAIDDILVVVEKLLKLQNGSFIFPLPVSCNEIQQKQPDNPSGYYNLNGKLVYCHMGKLCDTDGAWTRLGQLDMSDSTVNCPSGFQLYDSGGVRACGRMSISHPSCASIILPSNGISYSEVCGRVVGYQYGSSDAVDTRFKSNSTHDDIDSYYVDGVSITQGSPRRHIWTLMAGVKDSFYDDGNCPCNTPPGATQNIQDFIGTDYFCESGNPNNAWSLELYTNDPLWDGKGCGTEEAVCCSAHGLPWFHKSFNSTTDHIELRVCGDEPFNEDVPISSFELYVK